MLLPTLLGLLSAPLALSLLHSHTSVCIMDTVPLKLSTSHEKPLKPFNVSPLLQEIRTALCAGKCTSKQAGPEFKKARFSEWGALGEARGKHCEISFPLNNETEAYILRSTESGNDDREACLDITSQIIHDCAKDGPNVGRVEEIPRGTCYEAGVRPLSEPDERPGKADTAHTKIISFLKHPKGNKSHMPNSVQGTPAKGNPDDTHRSYDHLSHDHADHTHHDHKHPEHSHPDDDGPDHDEHGHTHHKHHNHPDHSHSDHKHPDHNQHDHDHSDNVHHSHKHTDHSHHGHKHPDFDYPERGHHDHKHPDDKNHGHGHGHAAKSKSAPSKREAIQQVEEFLQKIKQSFSDFQSCNDTTSSKCQNAISTFISADSDIENLTDVLSVIGFPEDEEITIPLRGLEALLRVIVKKVGKNRKVTKKVFDAVSGTIKTLQKSIHDIEDVLDKIDPDFESSQSQPSGTPSIPLPGHLGSIPLPKMPSFAGLGNILAEEPSKSGDSHRPRNAKSKNSKSKPRGPAEPIPQHAQAIIKGHGAKSTSEDDSHRVRSHQPESDSDAEADGNPPQFTSDDSTQGDAEDNGKQAFADLLSLPDNHDDDDDYDEENESAAGTAQEKNKGDASEGELDDGQEDGSEADTDGSDRNSALSFSSTESGPSTLDWTFMKPDGQPRNPKRKSDFDEPSWGPDEPERARKPKYSKGNGKSASSNGEEEART